MFEKFTEDIGQELKELLLRWAMQSLGPKKREEGRGLEMQLCEREEQCEGRHEGVGLIYSFAALPSAISICESILELDKAIPCVIDISQIV